MLLGAPGLTTRNKEATSVKKTCTFCICTSIHQGVKSAVCSQYFGFECGDWVEQQKTTGIEFGNASSCWTGSLHLGAAARDPCGGENVVGGNGH